MARRSKFYANNEQDSLLLDHSKYHNKENVITQPTDSYSKPKLKPSVSTTRPPLHSTTTQVVSNPSKHEQVDIYDLEHFIRDCNSNYAPAPTLNKLVLKTPSEKKNKRVATENKKVEKNEENAQLSNKKSARSHIHEANQNYVDPDLLAGLESKIDHQKLNVDISSKTSFKEKLLAASSSTDAPATIAPSQSRGLPKWNISYPNPEERKGPEALVVNNAKRFKVGESPSRRTSKNPVTVKKSSLVEVTSITSASPKPKFVVTSASSPIVESGAVHLPGKSPLRARYTHTTPKSGSSPRLLSEVALTPTPPPQLPRFTLPPSTPPRSTQPIENSPGTNSKARTQANCRESPSPVKIRSFNVRGGLLDFAQSLVNNIEDMVDLGGSMRYITKPLSISDSKVHVIREVNRWNRFTWFVKLAQDDKEMDCQLIDPKASVELVKGLEVRLGAVYDIIEIVEGIYCKVFISWKLVKKIGS
ncbi:hypothetical protein NADFUDRAFT_48991 [Nadsonia fulvescens var. elongata DSM 6958]|uniref:Uncharacterized protein n=1 Tax=Nadsonia fulvescens var. elongata DSM 6958 TaxID=857566 RepID=A0A1E3PSE7_9ASCO|nr:hypothetical protein NADFUDRAFT_48991 [Nadsonia fulvescens var. elongata DSM 6958]